MIGLLRNRSLMRWVVCVTLVSFVLSSVGVTQAWSLGLMDSQRQLAQHTMEEIDGREPDPPTPSPVPGDVLTCQNNNEVPICDADDDCETCESQAAASSHEKPSDLDIEVSLGSVGLFDELDLVLPVRGGMGINIKRNFTDWFHMYFSDTLAENTLGSYQWRMSYDNQLLEYSGTRTDIGDLLLVQGTHRRVFYSEFSGGSDTYRSWTNSSDYSTITKTGSDTFIRTLGSGKKEYYSATGWLTKIEDENDNAIIIYRDSTNERVTKIAGDSGSPAVTFYYDSSKGDHLTKISAPNGLDVVYEYDYAEDGQSEITKNIITKVAWKDGANELRSREYEYQPFYYGVGFYHFRLTKLSRNGETYRTIELDDGDYVLDENFQFQKGVAAVMNSEGVTKFERDFADINQYDVLLTKHYSPSKYLKQDVYMNVAHDVKTKVSYLGNGTTPLTKEFTFSGTGDNEHGRRMLTKQDMLEKQIKYGYRFESGGTTQYSDWRSWGKRTKTTDQYGNTMTSYYDETEARKTKVVAPNGNYVVPTYDNDGNVITRTVYDSSDNVLAKVAFVYDAYGQLRTKTVDPDDLAYDTIYEYNGLGQVTKTQSGCGCSAGSHYSWYDNMGRLTAAKGAISGAVATEYYPDKLGNVTKARAPIGDGTTYAEVVSDYDDGGRMTKLTDPENVVTEWRYDTEFRLTQVKDALDGETEYEYDYWNNLTKLIDQRDKQTTYEYDCFGRITKETDDDANSWTLEYDANGNLTKTIDAIGATSTTLEYDDAKVLTRINRPDGEYNVAYDYDTQRGLLTKLEELSGGDVLTFDYDKLGQLTKESYQDASTDIQYEYNSAQKLVTKTLPLVGSGNVYDYDDEGQLTKISSTTDPYASYLYDDDLRPTKVTYDNLTYTEYEYDKGGRLTRQELRHNYAGQLCAFDYYYDDAGNRTKVVLDDDANDWIKYYYDDLYRLTKEQRFGTANDYTNSYSYDAVGNRVASSRTNDDYGILEYLYNDINQLTMYYDFTAHIDSPRS
ncbi:hypothetical protein ACFL34_04795 [Candidatus Sumerlaeota bacterium]